MMPRFALALALTLACSACDTDAPQGEIWAPDMPVAAHADGGPDASPGDAGPDAGAPPLTQATEAPLAIEREADALTLTWRGEPRLRLPREAFQVATVAALDEAFNYDPWYLATDSAPPPPGLEWHRPAAWGLDTADGGATITLDFGDLGEGRLRLTASGERIAAHFTPPPGPVAYLRIRPTVGSDEAFYGLGEVFDTPNHRGHLRAMQLEVDRRVESLNNEAHVPIPLLIGTRGWGLLVDSAYPMVFDVAATADDQVDLIVAPGLAAGEGVTVHLFAADQPLDLTRHYYDLTGAPTLPAPWALGPWVWRDENEDQAEVVADLEAMRALDLPATGLWVDRPYASGVSSFDFHPGPFPEPQAMIDRAHALGFRFALWHTAYVGEDQPATADLHAEAEANGYYPPESGAIVNSWGRPVDFTNPEAWAWWQRQVARYTGMGVEGFKLDYMEDVVLGLGPVRNRWTFADGTTERTMHTRYQGLYHQVFREMLPEEGGFLLCRTGTVGDQTLGLIIWPGDLDATLLAHKEPGLDRRSGEPYTGVGGLPAALVAGLSLGPSGFPFFGSDTGGYRHCPPDKETFTRWFQQTALSPVMQIGTSCNDVAWQPTEGNGFDAEMLEWYRRYTRLHLRLWPYLWTLAHQMQQDGRPLMRPYGLQEPLSGHHPADTYFLGDHLLVAPVVQAGQRERLVRFPGGTWYDWWTGEQMGPDIQRVPAPLDTLPLFVNTHVAIPLLRPTIDTIAPTTTPDQVDSFATDPGRLYVHLGRWATGLRLYDGSEVALAFPEPAVIEVEWTPGAVFDERLEYAFVGVDLPLGADVDGVPLPRVESREALDAVERGLWFDAERGRLRIRPGEGLLTLTVP